MTQQTVPKPAKPKWTSYRPIFITLFATLLLSGGSFYGCATALDKRNWMHDPAGVWEKFFFWSFVVCSAAFVAALVWLIVVFIVNLIRSARESLNQGF
jgi:hypothetical protein